jgi:hypothetical protein
MNLRVGCVLAVMLSTALSAENAHADEFAFSSYGLGGAAFGAGVTPPAGTYVTLVSGYYEGDINGPVTIGGRVINVGMGVEFFQQATNILYVPESKVLGANLGLSVTIPVGHIDIDARVTGPFGNTVTESVDGWGFGDMNARVQLGWSKPEFSHTAYAAVVAPTGKYDPNGLQPNIGLNRPGIDVGWAFTWTASKLQVNAATGVTFNFENTDTDYKSGTDFHFEWAVGYEVCKGLVIGVVGYDYRQISGDSGAGAVLGPFEGDVDAIGGGVSYTTLIGATPVILNARHYEEFNAEKRMDGSMTILSGTARF